MERAGSGMSWGLAELLYPYRNSLRTLALHKGEDADERAMDENMDADAEDGSDAGDDKGNGGDSDGGSNSNGNSSGKSSDRVAMWEVQVGWRGAADVRMGEAKQRTSTNGMAGEVVSKLWPGEATARHDIRPSGMCYRGNRCVWR